MPNEENVKVPTKEAKERYVRSGGVRCPLCGSNQIEGGPFECEPGVVWQGIHCLVCEGDWIDVSRLVDIQNPDWPDTPSPRKKGPSRNATPAGRKKLLVDFGYVDWKLLRRQKESLLRVIGIADMQVGKKCQEDLQGILHLLDHIQDQAAERIGERAVFGCGKDCHS